MKKLINLLTVLIFMISPCITNAQTTDENWVSLGEYLQGNYKKKGKYLVPKYIGTFQYVSKLAYKTPEGERPLPKSNIIINTVNHIENHGIPVFDKTEPLIINELFEITQNGKPASGFSISEGDGGWKIIDLNGVGSISSVLVKQKSKTNDNDIFDHIYVYLDPAQDPYVIKEEILKKQKEKKEAQTKKSNYSGTTLPIIQ